MWNRYIQKIFNYKYKSKNIKDVMELTIYVDIIFFKIIKLKNLLNV